MIKTNVHTAYQNNIFLTKYSLIKYTITILLIIIKIISVQHMIAVKQEAVLKKINQNIKE